MTPREVMDLTEKAGTPADPLAMDATRGIARTIMNTVRDPKMAPSIAMKVARAVSERRLNASELVEILDSIESNRKRINSTGAYFVACIKRAFQRNEIVW